MVLQASRRVRGGIAMWIVIGIILILLFGYLGHALLYPEKY
ncbi:potassium-transporting ATPase subunit F [Lysinibacillus sphaericus]|uniref:Potassium-transporting ATPase subunit F n=2 Tax=Lysinibacillus TaxID=400634 RepID=A0ABY2TCA0_9BACI|nr:potassium-transporting ATPase subunit F [Lysinibacillus sphaericus]TKI50136.1 potassium-transporting ATPase subunit F [Lysinibacillus tabacifolii]TKI61149.1 potassium-transporting ATPase subunit F [Lysinibacillus varians]UDK97632.1 potassium-transporting ATPase subunit F [Lysinibacillus sphaericus]